MNARSEISFARISDSRKLLRRSSVMEKHMYSQLPTHSCE